MKHVFIDSETCGLHGCPVLLQYAIEDGEIELFDIWLRPVHETLSLIEDVFLPNICVFFNATFDWFHICKLYTIWRLLPGDWIPAEHINEIAAREKEAKDGPCIKPASTLDLMLYSRTTTFQSLMDRADIRIRRVPSVLADALAKELGERVEIDDIYFARSKNPDAPRWAVYDTKDPDFKDVCLKFKPAGGLKYLAEHVLGYEPKFHFEDVELDTKFRPYEKGYAPTANTFSCVEKGWKVEPVSEVEIDEEEYESFEVTYDEPTEEEIKTSDYEWPAVIKYHIEHWATNDDAREYARDDIVYTRGLFDYFGRPAHGDDDSVLACSVAAIRWRGYVIDVDGIREAREEAERIAASSPVNLNKHSEVREYLAECLDVTESTVIAESVRKQILKSMTTDYATIEEGPCTKCDGLGCVRCDGTGHIAAGPHPVLARVEKILECKSKLKAIDNFKKLEAAGRFHASFKIIGTKSSRMSGADGLNAQGVGANKQIRKLFHFAWPGYELSLGDFWAFEVCLAQAVYRDEKLKADLLKLVPCHKCDATGIDPKSNETCGECDGTTQTTQKLHGLFAMALFPGHSYEEIIASDGTSNDMYTKGKQGVFGGVFYGGNEHTLVRNLGVSVDNALAAFKSFGSRYPGVARRRDQVSKMFNALQQPGGIGSAIYWVEPADSIDNGLGFKRYFTLENKICRALYTLSRTPPKPWRALNVKVSRRDRVQTASGAVSSALYGAAFSICGANIRAAANHEIQSKGAQITKNIQRMIWDLQPAGVHEFVVAPCNIHDEIVTPVLPEYVEQVSQIIRDGVEKYRDVCPLLGIDWTTHAESWAEKKAGTMKIRPLELCQ